MEMIDLYTLDGLPTGECIPRDTPIPPDRMRLGVRVWLKNRDGLFLISQRSETRLSHPLFWEPTGGGVSAGETPRLSAVREVREELGISIPQSSLRLLSKDMIFDGIEQLYTYWAPCNAIVIKAKLQKEEVRDAKWATIEEIRRIKAAGQFYGDIDILQKIQGHGV